jgi:hypothetical protein
MACTQCRVRNTTASTELEQQLTVNFKSLTDLAQPLRGPRLTPVQAQRCLEHGPNPSKHLNNCRWLLHMPAQ